MINFSKCIEYVTRSVDMHLSRFRYTTDSVQYVVHCMTYGSSFKSHIVVVNNVNKNTRDKITVQCFINNTQGYIIIDGYRYDIDVSKDIINR